ncbi:hypothetical protein Pcinc_037541, partial [Petrolisthes cinctipes]
MEMRKHNGWEEWRSGGCAWVWEVVRSWKGKTLKEEEEECVVCVWEVDGWCLHGGFIPRVCCCQTVTLHELEKAAGYTRDVPRRKCAAEMTLRSPSVFARQSSYRVGITWRPLTGLVLPCRPLTGFGIALPSSYRVGIALPSSYRVGIALPSSYRVGIALPSSYRVGIALPSSYRVGIALPSSYRVGIALPSSLTGVGIALPSSYRVGIALPSSYRVGIALPSSYRVGIALPSSYRVGIALQFLLQ